MAVRHINQNAKEESGIILSGVDADKVFSMFSANKTASYIKDKKTKIHALFANDKLITTCS